MRRWGVVAIAAAWAASLLVASQGFPPAVEWGSVTPGGESAEASGAWWLEEQPPAVGPAEIAVDADGTWIRILGGAIRHLTVYASVAFNVTYDRYRSSNQHWALWLPMGVPLIPDGQCYPLGSNHGLVDASLGMSSLEQRQAGRYDLFVWADAGVLTIYLNRRPPGGNATFDTLDDADVDGLETETVDGSTRFFEFVATESNGAPYMQHFEGDFPVEANSLVFARWATQVPVAAGLGRWKTELVALPQDPCTSLTGERFYPDNEATVDALLSVPIQNSTKLQWTGHLDIPVGAGARDIYTQPVVRVRTITFV